MKKSETVQVFGIDLVQSSTTIAGALLEAAGNDPQFVAERGRGPHLVDENQIWQDETTYYRFADDSCIRITPYEAEEISAEEYDAAEALEADRHARMGAGEA